MKTNHNKKRIWGGGTFSTLYDRLCFEQGFRRNY